MRYLSGLILVSGFLLLMGCNSGTNDTDQNGKSDSLKIADTTATDTLADSLSIPLSDSLGAGDSTELGDPVPEDTGATNHRENNDPKRGQSEEALDCQYKVSFISKGEGINTKAEKRFGGFVKSYIKSQGYDVRYEVKAWGREGEMDYCFDLSKLTDLEKRKFKMAVDKTLKGEELVLISDG